MKSMLHEASSVSKAIEKAWVDSGKPREFSVKIHELGEKNFFGFTTRSAVVSLTYDPRKPSSRQTDKKTRTSPYQPSKIQSHQSPKPKQDAPSDQKRQKEFSRTEVRPEASTTSLKQQIIASPQQVDLGWTPELVVDARAWFQDVFNILSKDISFELKPENKSLYVILNQRITNTQEDERQLVMSLSYLVIQFLKKKYKRKLRGFHLLINTKHHVSADQSSS